MGISNFIVFNYMNAPYGSEAYTVAIIPFIAALAAGTAVLFLVRKKTLAQPWTEKGKLPLFLVFFLPLAGMAMYYIITGGELSTAFLLPSACALLVGIAEETMFRRILYIDLLKSGSGQGFTKPLLISATFFSLLHAVNVFAGATGTRVLMQLATTLAAGLFFALMYDYTHSIFLMIATHCLWDYLLMSGAVEKIPAFSVAMTVLTLAQPFLSLVLFIRKRRLR